MVRKRNKKTRQDEENTSMKTISKNDLLRELKTVFLNVQQNTSYHEKCLKVLQNLFPLVEQDVFFDLFVKCLQIPLQIGEKNPYVERCLDFAAKFCTSFEEVPNPENDDELEMHPFLAEIFKYSLKYHRSNSSDFRYRLCQFVNKILVFLGEQAELDDKLCDNILRAMLDRLQDPKYKVRTQAVIALHRLQNPNDPNDPVTKSYFFHMEKDPSPQVRRAVVNNLARSIRAFPQVMERIRDTDEKVRRDAYNFIGMYSLKNFKIVQRMSILKSGLTDRSKLVKRCVSENLIPKWFVHYERSYFDFLKAIRVDVNVQTIKDSNEVSKLLLNVFFMDGSANEIIQVLQLNEQKMLRPEFLDHEHVLYWRYLCEFFHKQNAVGEEFLDNILPTLTEFCGFIKSFVEKNCGNDREVLEENIYQSILQQLFEMIQYFDLSDEAGRNNLLKLIKEMLLYENLSTSTVDVMVEKVLERLIPHPKERIATVIEIITEITEPMEELEIEESDDSKRRKEVKLHELRFTLNCLNDDEEIAVEEKDYIKAAEIKEEIKQITEKLKELTAAPKPVAQVRKRTNDDNRVLKALDIVAAMFQSTTIRELTPELRVLQQNFITEYCTQTNTPAKIESAALKCLACCSYLDEELAISVMPKFFYRLMAYQYKLTTNREVIKTALCAVFDLLLIYDASKFQPPADNTVTGANKTRLGNAGNKTKRTLYDGSQYDEDISDDEEDEIETQDVNFSMNAATTNEIISCILSFLDDEWEDFRTIAAQGLILLLDCGKFKSTEVLTRLIILWFNPATEKDSKMRQVLGVMLNHFAMNTPGSQEEFAKAFLPTIRTVLDAPTTSPLAHVDVDTVINFLLTYTQPGFNSVDDANVHNYLAVTLCDEILKNGIENESREKMHLIKCLPNLAVSDDDCGLRIDLQNLCLKIIDATKNKNYIRCVRKFMQQIQEKQPDEINELHAEDSNQGGDNSTNITENNTNTTSTSNNTSNNRRVSELKKDILNKSLRVALTRFDEQSDKEDGNMEIDTASSVGSPRSLKNQNGEEFNISTSEAEEDYETSSSDEEVELPKRGMLIQAQIHTAPRRTSLRSRSSIGSTR
ncbi:condensin complex subunit 3 [Chrysoperla carnea]|uniref:condensin complex subunit 3 n=1 Tax=Chrysoperla carnea TaxID=189513 RepID=UPI001D096BAF|nr:condensin complex subunit 3 [Chrysoperla carnea]